MADFERFEQLDEKDFFLPFVASYFNDGWQRVSQASGSSVETGKEFIELAFDRYHINIQQYRVALKSKNPDQYKRAGALWHALYTAPPIIEVKWNPETERYLNGDNVGVSVDDHNYWMNYTGWYADYCNQMMTFDLAFRCCQVYEQDKKTYTKDYLDNICYYMAENTNINVGSFVMILKSYMANGH